MRHSPLKESKNDDMSDLSLLRKIQRQMKEDAKRKDVVEAEVKGTPILGVVVARAKSE